jgi:hypothetical protein
MMLHLDQSLRELNTDYIDIWYLHGKDRPDQVPDELIEGQQLAKQQGKIRFAGVSTHSGQQQIVPWMVKKNVFDVVLAAYNFTMDASMDQAIDAAAKAGVGVVAMKVMAGGFRGLKPGNPLSQKLAQPGASRHHRSQHDRHGPARRKSPGHAVSALHRRPPDSRRPP